MSGSGNKANSKGGIGNKIFFYKKLRHPQVKEGSDWSIVSDTDLVTV